MRAMTAQQSKAWSDSQPTAFAQAISSYSSQLITISTFQLFVGQTQQLALPDLLLTVDKLCSSFRQTMIMLSAALSCIESTYFTTRTENKRGGMT